MYQEWYSGQVRYGPCTSFEETEFNWDEEVSCPSTKSVVLLIPSSIFSFTPPWFQIGKQVILLCSQRQTYFFFKFVLELRLDTKDYLKKAGNVESNRNILLKRKPPP